MCKPRMHAHTCEYRHRVHVKTTNTFLSCVQATKMDFIFKKSNFKNSKNYFKLILRWIPPGENNGHAALVPAFMGEVAGRMGQRNARSEQKIPHSDFRPSISQLISSGCWDRQVGDFKP